MTVAAATVTFRNFKTVARPAPGYPLGRKVAARGGPKLPASPRRLRRVAAARISKVVVFPCPNAKSVKFLRLQKFTEMML